MFPLFRGTPKTHAVLGGKRGKYSCRQSYCLSSYTKVMTGNDQIQVTIYIEMIILRSLVYILVVDAIRMGS